MNQKSGPDRMIKICLILITVIISLCVLILPVTSVVDYGDRTELTTRVNVTNDFDIVNTASSAYISNISLTASSYPRNDSRQTTKYILLEPLGQIDFNEQIVRFSWENPRQKSFNFKIESEVRTVNRISELYSKVTFPIPSLDSSFYDDIKPTATIDITPEIKDQASELSLGKDDLYEVEYSFAEFVRKNVAYDLSTLNSGVNQKSSWVLANKRGVCDEITNLFISLNRASGIPARFVSGVAYTNLDIFGTPWVAHAWAEVYFPGFGWIPYDVTYGEYGFLDSGHIKLTESSDATGANVKYDYIGNNILLKPGELKTDVEVLDTGAQEHAKYTFSASLQSANIGFGSYDIVAVEAVNNEPYYQVADIYLGDTEDIGIIEDSAEKVMNKAVHRKEVLLPPKERRTVYWIIKLDNNLNENYIYTFPVTTYNSYNETSTAYLKSAKGDISLSQDYVDNYVSSKQQEAVRKYSANVMLQCDQDKEQMYIEDTLNITCTLDNKGDRSFDNVMICLEDKCSSRPLGIQKISFDFDKTFDSLGLKNILIKAYNNDFSKSTYVTINVKDKPSVDIVDLDYPSVVLFEDIYSVKFRVQKNSSSNPKNVDILIESPLYKNEWKFPEMTVDRIFSVDSNGKSMKPNENDYVITVNYEDDKGNKFSEIKNFTILSKANFFQNIVLWFNEFTYWVENL